MEYGHKISKVYLNTKIFESFIRILRNRRCANIFFAERQDAVICKKAVW